MKRLITGMLVVFGVISVTAVVVPAPPVHAADKSCDEYILTFPAWYNGLASKEGSTCVIDAPAQDADGANIRKFVAQIILNIIDILMQLVAYGSVVYLIIGGARYLTSIGRPDKMTIAQKTILNAIIGLIIALLAVTIVNLVGASL